MLKNLYVVAFLAVVGITFGSPSFATTLGFNGVYDYSTWTSTNTLAGGPTVSTIDSSHQVLNLFEPNNGGGAQQFNFSHTVTTSGTISFDWTFDARIDACCSGLEFYQNGTLYNLAGNSFVQSNWTGPLLSGHFSVAVNVGDTITFGAFSNDGCCGATTNTITNFDAPVSAVPEPSTWAMMVVGFASVGFMTYRRSRKDQGLALAVA
jgi:hypothetical protein